MECACACACNSLQFHRVQGAQGKKTNPSSHARLSFSCFFFYIAVCLLSLSFFSHGNLWHEQFLFQQRPGRGLVRCPSKQETLALELFWWKRRQGTLFSENLPLGPACISSPCLISFQLECKTDSCIAKWEFLAHGVHFMPILTLQLSSAERLPNKANYWSARPLTWGFVRP